MIGASSVLDDWSVRVGLWPLDFVAKHPIENFAFVLFFCSHFLYPVQQQELAPREAEYGDVPSGSSNGKYELFSQVDEIVKREMRQLVQCESYD